LVLFSGTPPISPQGKSKLELSTMSENQENIQPITVKTEDIITYGDGLSHPNYNESQLSYELGSQHDEIKQVVNLMKAEEQHSIQQNANTAGDWQDFANTYLQSTNSNLGWNDYESTLIDSEARRQGTQYPVVTQYPLSDESTDSFPNPSMGEIENSGDAGEHTPFDNPPTLPHLPQEEIETVWQDNRPESTDTFETITPEATHFSPTTDANWESQQNDLGSDFNEPIDSSFNNDLGSDFNESIESSFNDNLGTDFNEPIDSSNTVDTTSSNNIDNTSLNSSLDNDF
jgi:hypothetical protein